MLWLRTSDAPMNVLGALRIPVRIAFEESFDLDTRERTAEIIAQTTVFCTRRQDADVDELVNGIAGDADLSLQALGDALGRCDFQQEHGFMDVVDVFVCRENISIDQTSKYCICIGDASGEQEIAAAFDEILNNEVRKRLETLEKKWGLGVLTGIFKSNPASDKRLADGLFAAGRHREAGRVYSKYREDDAFSHYCTEMTVYCLALCGKPLPHGIAEYMKRSEFRFGIHLIRLITVALGLDLDVLAMNLLPVLDADSVFRALVGEELLKRLGSEGRYRRKMAEIAFVSALGFDAAGFHRRSTKCAEHFLACKDSGVVAGLDAEFLRPALRHIAKMLGRSSEQSSIEADVKMFRVLGGSLAEFQGTINRRESLLLQCSREGQISITDSNGQLQTHPTNANIWLERADEFLIRDIVFGDDGIKQILEINVPVMVEEDARFIHVEADDSHEVYCGEEYRLGCRIVRNFACTARMMLNGDSFETDVDAFAFQTVFTTTGVFLVELVVESGGMRALREIRFVVSPSFSISMFNYKYCLPLVFLRIQSHVQEDARVRLIRILNRDFDVVGTDAVRSVYSYKESAIKYFREKIIGVDVSVETNRHGGRCGGSQETFGSIEKCMPVASDLFFGDIVRESSGEVGLASRRCSFVRVFLRRKEDACGDVLDLKADCAWMTQGDRQRVCSSRLGFVGRNKDQCPGLSAECTLPHEAPVKIEIELRSGRMCMFVLSGLFSELALESAGSTKIFQPLVPFVYVTHSSAIRLNEPTVMYVCISNYYEYCKLSVELASHSIVICKDDCAFDVDPFSFSFSEIRSVFLKRKKYGTEDLRIQIRAEGEDARYEGIIDLPFVM